MKTKKVALITGASSGIGASAADLLKENGFTVYGAARRVDKMKDLESKGVSTIELDVTKEESIVKCVNTIIEKEGSIDVLINNAGYGSYGAIEDVPLEEARRQFDVNIFGLARLTQLVLPKMRENRFGKIVNISSTVVIHLCDLTTFIVSISKRTANTRTFEPNWWTPVSTM